jgi:hypothetical protein
MNRLTKLFRALDHGLNGCEAGRDGHCAYCHIWMSGRTRFTHRRWYLRIAYRQIVLIVPLFALLLSLGGYDITRHLWPWWAVVLQWRRNRTAESATGHIVTSLPVFQREIRWERFGTPFWQRRRVATPQIREEAGSGEGTVGSVS